MGESTCSGILGAEGCKYEGQREKEKNCAIFSINELSRIAMERTETARDAIDLMGNLAEEGGFQGAGTFEGSAESLLITDTEEAWIFHVLPSDRKGSSAVWVAQLVPEDHAAVVANTFIIREVDFDSDSFK